MGHHAQGDRHEDHVGQAEVEDESGIAPGGAEIEVEGQAGCEAEQGDPVDDPECRSA